MSPQVNWQKLRGELNKLADVEKLKVDLKRIAAEIRNFDFHTVLTPQAQERVKAFEKKYADLIKTAHQVQRQVDREVNKIIRQVKDNSLLADVRLQGIRKVATSQRQKLTHATQEIRKRLSKMNGKRKGKRKTGVRKTKSSGN